MSDTNSNSNGRYVTYQWLITWCVSSSLTGLALALTAVGFAHGAVIDQLDRHASQPHRDAAHREEVADDVKELRAWMTRIEGKIDRINERLK